MSYVIIENAMRGKYLDGRDRPTHNALGEPSLPPNTTVCLVKATENFKHHRKGDVWVEYMDTK